MSLILEENRRRNLILDAYYNPLTGEGSTLDRQTFELSDLSEKLYLPVSMLNVPLIQKIGEYGSLTEFANREKKNNPLLLNSSDPVGVVRQMFLDERLDQDYEFYAATCQHIQDKNTFKDYAFILRGAQRKLLFALEEMRLSGVPIRIVLLKARQWGGSTLVDMYAFWLQQRHRINWHMVICAQDDSAAGNISSMYDYAVDHYPFEIGKLVGVKGSTKNRKDNIRGHRVNIGSVQNPKQFRSFNNAIVHMTETGIWDDTLKRSSMKVVAALKETVPDEPYTMVVEESTANGLNYFHDSWIKAEKGETRYKGVFIPWYEIDRDRVNVEDCQAVYDSLSDYELYQWSLGATIEGIQWYRMHKADKGYDDATMMEENPCTPSEAFQSSGQKVFPPIYVDTMRKDVMPPIFEGEVHGDARFGKKAFDNLRFEKAPKGFLRIWKMPEVTHEHQYVVVVDIGGKSLKADNSIITVLERKGLLFDESYLEVVAEWAGHTDHDVLAWKAAQIATMYGGALLVIESNSLKKNPAEEGAHFLTVLDQIKDDYRNLYIRNNEENVGSEFVPKYGFFTGDQSKGLAISALNACMRERHMKDKGENHETYIIERCNEACNEASWYETKPDGSQGAIKGKRDDRLITRAIGCHVALHRMPLPKLLRVEQYVRPVARKRSESSIF